MKAPAKRKPKPPLTEEQRRLAEEHWELGLKFGRVWQQQYKSRGFQLPDELVESAVANGLIDAVRTFDPGRGFKFWTYAGWKLRGALLDAMRVHPVTGRQKRKPDFWEKSPKFVSLHRVPCNMLDGPKVVDIQHLLPDARTEVRGDRESFEALIRPLRRSARAALRLIFIEGLNQKEAGREIGVSESRCSQIVSEALAYLRAHHRDNAVA